MDQVGFGGGCHWCTEAVFQSLKGVLKVEQGWISSTGAYSNYSEAALVYFDEREIDLHTLISIHLHTHSCTSSHSFRSKYRSAIYSFSPEQTYLAKEIIRSLQKEFKSEIITKVLPFSTFKRNKEQYLDYYLKNSENQFCRTYINPKIGRVRQNFYSNTKETH